VTITILTLARVVANIPPSKLGLPDSHRRNKSEIASNTSDSTTAQHSPNTLSADSVENATDSTNTMPTVPENVATPKSTSTSDQTPTKTPSSSASGHKYRRGALSNLLQKHESNTDAGIATGTSTSTTSSSSSSSSLDESISYDATIKRLKSLGINMDGLDQDTGSEHPDGQRVLSMRKRTNAPPTSTMVLPLHANQSHVDPQTRLHRRETLRKKMEEEMLRVKASQTRAIALDPTPTPSESASAESKPCSDAEAEATMVMKLTQEDVSQSGSVPEDNSLLNEKPPSIKITTLKEQPWYKVTPHHNKKRRPPHPPPVVSPIPVESVLKPSSYQDEKSSLHGQTSSLHDGTSVASTTRIRKSDRRHTRRHKHHGSKASSVATAESRTESRDKIALYSDDLEIIANYVS
jgi:hypothetical protein